MQKLAFSLFIFFFITHFIFAQNATPFPQEFIDRMAVKCCKQCMEKLNLENKSASQINEEFSTCFSQVVGEDINEILKYVTLEEFGEKMGRQLGEEIAKVLLKNCPSYMQFALKVAKLKEKEESSSVAAFTQANGKIKRLETKDFVYLLLEDTKGKEISLIWLEYFKGSENLPDKIEELKKKNVSVKWEEIECYLPKMKGYYKIKQIVELSILD